MPWLTKERGFTLIELLAVMVILAVLAFVATPRVIVADYGLLTTRDAIIAAASQAQQIAMARDSAANPVRLVVGAAAVEVQENGVAVASPGTENPFPLPNGVSITGGLGTLDYDKLGRTGATTISLNGGAATVSVEASGYAH